MVFTSNNPFLAVKRQTSRKHETKVYKNENSRLSAFDSREMFVMRKLWFVFAGAAPWVVSGDTPPRELAVRLSRLDFGNLNLDFSAQFVALCNTVDDSLIVDNLA